MIRQLLVFCVLLFGIQHVRAQAQKAVWKFPNKGKDLEANTIDIVLLNWTSTLPDTILRTWCQIGIDSVNLALVSSFYVDSAGPFKYVMETYKTDEMEFPLSCHFELSADPQRSGFDSLAGILWSNDSSEAAKTISQTQAASSVTVTVERTPSPSSTPTSVTSSTSNSGSLSSTGPITTDSVPQSTTPTSSEKQPDPISTTSSESPSNATSSRSSTSTNSNNTGAIIGGAIGGVALLNFIAIALLFLRKYQRNRALLPRMDTKPSKRSFYLFNAYSKRGPKARIMDVLEMEGDRGAYELQGSAASKTASKGERWASGQQNHQVNSSPIELPCGSNYFR